MDRNFARERELCLAWADRFRRPAPGAYERAARAGFARSGIPVGERDLRRLLRSSRLTVFGDDRLVPDDAEKTAALASEIEGGRRVTLVTGRSRPHAIAYGRRRGWQVVLHGEGDSFERGDREILRRVRRAAGRVVVWTGSLRLSPGMLPRILAGPAVFCCLEGAETRWASGRREGWVRIGPGQHLFVERSPLLSLECFRAWSARSPRMLRAGDLSRAFGESLARISATTGQRKPPAPRMLLSPFDLSALDFLSDRRRDPRTRRFLWERLLSGESAVLPGRGTVLLSTLDPGHVAEEAAHYARLWNVRTGRLGAGQIVLEEALAFLASSWLDPSRMESPAPGAVESRWESLHRFGYDLGLRLVRRWRESARHRETLRAVWREVPRDEREALRILEVLRSLA